MGNGFWIYRFSPNEVFKEPITFVNWGACVITPGIKYIHYLAQSFWFGSCLIVGITLRGKHCIPLSFLLLSTPFVSDSYNLLICGNTASEITSRKHSMLENYVNGTQQTMNETYSCITLFFSNSVSTFILSVHYVPFLCSAGSVSDSYFAYSV